MPLSQEKLERCQAAVEALHAFREEYGDALVVLDYVSLADVSNYHSDSNDIAAGAVLDDDEMSAVLWHVGKHVGCMSQDILASLVEFALDEHVRRSIAQRFSAQKDE